MLVQSGLPEIFFRLPELDELILNIAEMPFARTDANVFNIFKSTKCKIIHLLDFKRLQIIWVETKKFYWGFKSSLQKP